MFTCCIQLLQGDDMQIYKRILVTIDCSPVDDCVVDHVSGLAVQNKAEVFLLHVVHSHTRDQDRALLSSATTAMDRHRETLEQQGIKVHVVLKSGEPDEQILKEIAEQQYDLVAMATHGHSFIGDLLFGSVSRTLKHQIDVPLLLIRSRC